jgi:hypothetical protein
LEKKIANIISLLLHPLLMPFLGIALLLNSPAFFLYNISLAAKSILCLFILLTTFIIPVLINYWLYRSKIIKNFKLDQREDRRLPYLVTAASYTMTYYFLLKTPLPRIIPLMMLSATTSVICALIINFKWKISAHMIGIGGLAGALIGIALRLTIDLHLFIIIFILLSGLIGFSRLKLETHSPAQIYSGFLLGLFLQISLLYWN